MIGLIAVPFLTLWIGAFFEALGLLFAPAFAFCCQRSARLNGLDGRRYALMGGLYSCLFFIPAIFLLAEIRGREVSENATKRTYVILYSYWGIGPIGLTLLLDFAGGGSVLWIGLCIVWIASIVKTTNRSQEFRIAPLPITSYTYIVPFALAYLSSAVSIVFSIAGWA